VSCSYFMETTTNCASVLHARNNVSKVISAFWQELLRSSRNAHEAERHEKAGVLDPGNTTRLRHHMENAKSRVDREVKFYLTSRSDLAVTV
jgi:hypothetical protein